MDACARFCVTVWLLSALVAPRPVDMARAEDTEAAPTPDAAPPRAGVFPLPAPTPGSSGLEGVSNWPQATAEHQDAAIASRAALHAERMEPPTTDQARGKPKQRDRG